METVTLSLEYQITIPASLRESLKLSAGQRFQLVAYRNRIELIPLKPMPAMRGFLVGIDTAIERGPDRL